MKHSILIFLLQLLGMVTRAQTAQHNTHGFKNEDYFGSYQNTQMMGGKWKNTSAPDNKTIRIYNPFSNDIVVTIRYNIVNTELKVPANSSATLPFNQNCGAVIQDSKGHTFFIGLTTDVGDYTIYVDNKEMKYCIAPK
jgi:hypothetical protein